MRSTRCRCQAGSITTPTQHQSLHEPNSQPHLLVALRASFDSACCPRLDAAVPLQQDAALHCLLTVQAPMAQQRQFTSAGPSIHQRCVQRGSLRPLSHHARSGVLCGILGPVFASGCLAPCAGLPRTPGCSSGTRLKASRPFQPIPAAVGGPFSACVGKHGCCCRAAAAASAGKRLCRPGGSSALVHRCAAGSGGSDTRRCAGGGALRGNAATTVQAAMDVAVCSGPGRSPGAHHRIH